MDEDLKARIAAAMADPVLWWLDETACRQRREDAERAVVAERWKRQRPVN